MTKTATYISDDIQAWFTAETERDSFDAPFGEHINPESVEVTALTILGVDVDLCELPAGLQDKIRSLADDSEFN